MPAENVQDLDNRSKRPGPSRLVIGQTPFAGAAPERGNSFQPCSITTQTKRQDAEKLACRRCIDRGKLFAKRPELLRTSKPIGYVDL